MPGNVVGRWSTCVHVRHVHRQLEPPGAVLQRDLRELLRLHVLQRSEGAERAAVQQFHMPDDPYPDALVLERRDFDFEVDLPAHGFRVIPSIP